MVDEKALVFVPLNTTHERLAAMRQYFPYYLARDDGHEQLISRDKKQTMIDLRGISTIKQDAI